VDRNTLIKEACEAALEINEQLNFLLDSYDIFREGLMTTPISTCHIVDVNTAIKEITGLTKLMSIVLQQWKNGVSEFSAAGLEIHVLNELHVQILTLFRFLELMSIHSSTFDLAQLNAAVERFRIANRGLNKVTHD
jgi:hypothetical protein